MPTRVFVTGIGMITPVGLDTKSSWKALLAGTSGISTITAFDPYPPPTLGMAIQVFTRDARHGGHAIDTQALTRAPTDDTVATGFKGFQATAQAAGVFDARNHTTLGLLREYAAGRTEPDSPFGTEVYLMDIELYTQFVSYWLIHDLLNFERSRLSPVEDASQR